MRLMFCKSRRVYLDHASATPVRKEAQRANEEASRLVGNPGSIHQEGVEAKRVLEESRARIAKELGCKAREIVFTSGLTEANNLAILGRAKSIEATPQGVASIDGGLGGTHWVVSSIEHQSVLECFSEIERRGGRVTHIDPETNGVISPQKIANALRPETVLVSVGWANSEIGTIQPIREISFAIRSHEKKTNRTVLLHSDAGQGPLYLSPEVHTLGVDLFSLGSGKLYGSRGIGALYIGKRVEIAPVVVGGDQERGLRAGTESPALAAGFAAALAAVSLERREEAARVGTLRDELSRIIEENVQGAVINGDLRQALPHMLNISIPHVNSEYVVLALDRCGIATSTKAACSEGRSNESHVVAALVSRAAPRWRAENTIRLSLGRESRRGDISRAGKELSRILKEMPIS